MRYPYRTRLPRRVPDHGSRELAGSAGTEEAEASQAMTKFWKWWLLCLLVAPAMVLVNVAFLLGYAVPNAPQRFEWRAGLQFAVPFVILSILLFLASLGIRYLAGRQWRSK
jgi:hypothetical protein